MAAPTEASFDIKAPDAREILFGSGPRFARDAAGPMLAFFLVWKVAGLVPGILVATAVSLLAWRHERRHDRPGLMARVSLGIVVVQAAVGIVAQSEVVYLAQPVLIGAAYGAWFIVSALIGRPLAGAFAVEMSQIPEEVRRSVTFRRIFGFESVVWGLYLLVRSALRLVTLSSSVEAFVVVNLVTGFPVMSVLLAWSVWYGVRAFRSSEEWGPAIRAMEEAQGAAATPTATA
jgi:intracellular septation protein A